MSVAHQRQEILRLIARMSGDPSRAATRLGTPSRATKEREDRRSRRRPIARGRWGAQDDPPRDGRLLLRLQRLEQRVEQLESGGALGPASSERATGDPQAALAAPQGAASEHAARLAKSTLGGRIKEGLLADVLQMVASNQFTGIFTVSSDEGTNVDVVFSEGEIQHASSEGLSGEGAFFAAMQIDQGFFFFEETKELPPDKTIEAKAQFLILEALRQIDESQAGAGET